MLIYLPPMSENKNPMGNCLFLFVFGRRLSKKKKNYLLLFLKKREQEKKTQKKRGPPKTFFGGGGAQKFLGLFLKDILSGKGGR